MKAIVLARPDANNAPTISIDEVPKPKVKPGYLLVKIHAASINPSDHLNAAGGFPYTTFPRLPGRDFAGTIVDGPADSIGRVVFGTSGRTISFTEDGVHAEFCLVPDDAVVDKPSNISFAQAASIGVPFTTAALALRRGQAEAHDTVLVLGATGNVGSAVTQLARSKGCKVITASRQDTTDVNIKEDPAFSKVREVTGGKGADVVIDTVGDPVLMKAALGVLAQGGRLAYIAAPRSGSTEFSFDMKSLYRQEQSIIGCNSLSYTAARMGAELRAIAPLLENGQLKASAEEELAKIDLEAALELYKDPKAHGGRKYIIQFV